MRVMAVDHGEKRIGIAVSDPAGTLARPLRIIRHQARASDAARVAALVRENQSELIVIGEALDEGGMPKPAGRRAMRFADELRSIITTPIVFWDESLSTLDARRARLLAGASRKKRAAPIDALAASMILQSYLDAHRSSDDAEVGSSRA